MGQTPERIACRSSALAVCLVAIGLAGGRAAPPTIADLRSQRGRRRATGCRPRQSRTRRRTTGCSTVRLTGGEVHDLGAASNNFKRIFDDFRASYMLRFTPEGVAGNGWHDLSVTLLWSDADRYRVRARRGYWGN